METQEIDALVSELENRLERLRVLYEQYFLGFEKLEPLVVRKDVERRFFTLAKTKIRNTAIRFRYQRAVQKFSTYQSYWARICRQIEDGTYKRIANRTAKIKAEAQRKSSVPPAYQLDIDAFQDDAEKQLDALFSDSFNDEPPTSVRESAKMPAAASATETGNIVALAPPLPPINPDARPLIASAVRPTTEGAVRAPVIRPSLQMSATRPSGSTPAIRPATSAAPGAARPPVPTSDARPLAPESENGIAARPPGAPPLPGRAVPRAPVIVPKVTEAQPPAAVPSGSPPRVAPAGARPAIRPSLQMRAVDGPSPAKPRPAAPAGAPGDLSEDRMRQLYSSYIEAKRANRESTAAITYDSMAKSIRESSAKLKEKHGGRNVDFEVATKDGKTVLRPVVK